MTQRAGAAVCIFAIAASLVSAIPVHAATSDVEPPAPRSLDAKLRRIALGASMYNGRDISELDDFRASIGGRRVAMWTIWTNWGTPALSPFPMAAANAAKARGAVPVIWWEPVNQGWEQNGVDTTYSSNKNIIDGLHDEYIREFARDAKRYKGRVLLRFAHQANSDTLPWGWDYSKTDGNTRQTFIAAWRHVRNIFRQERAWNVKFLWTIATQTCAGPCLKRRLGFPGRKYVDYMGFTWENWGKAGPDSVVPSRRTISMLDGFRPVVRKLSRLSKRPIIAAAIASGPDGGKRPRWIRTGYPAVYKQLKRVVGISWLNEDLGDCCHYHRDWSLTGASLKAYADIAARPRFRGRIR